MPPLISESPKPSNASSVSLQVDPPNADALLRDALKRCPPKTYEAAREFRNTGRTELVPIIVLGVIERFVQSDLRAKLASGNSDLRLVEDLGMDSLTMMEIVMLIEEVLPLSIANDELKELRTLGDISAFVACKLYSVPPAATNNPPRSSSLAIGAVPTTPHYLCSAEQINFVKRATNVSLD